MNRKILVSLGVIGVVAAIAIGGTAAYFSDTETSQGNTFTAGTLDLIVDIDGEVFNPLDKTIFSYDDMKPGDEGEETISLLVQNDACGFVTFDVTSDLDNGCTEPELDDESNCASDNVGELNDNVDWNIWLDQGGTSGWQCNGINTQAQPCAADPTECDNIWADTALEPELISGALTNSVQYGFGKMDQSVHYCYGFQWDFDKDTNNIAQSDSFTADMILKADQYRNQYGPGTANPDGCPTGLQNPTGGDDDDESDDDDDD